MDLSYSDTLDDCSVCNKQTRNICEFCGTAYCDDCFKNNEYQCDTCNQGNYE